MFLIESFAFGYLAWKIKYFKEVSSNLDPDDPMQADLAILNTAIANIVNYDTYLNVRSHELNAQIYDNDFTINGIGGPSDLSSQENYENKMDSGTDSGKIRYYRLNTLENSDDPDADVIGNVGIIDNFYP